MNVVLFGSVGLVLIMMFIPALGLGLGFQGLLGAVMILLFGFLFVTVSSRLTECPSPGSTTSSTLAPRARSAASASCARPTGITRSALP